MGIAKLQLGRRLRKLRETEGWSQRELGRRVWPALKPDSAQGRISHYESERSRPSQKDLARLAKILNVSILELFADPITLEKSIIPLIQKRDELVKKRPRTMFDLKITDDDSLPYLRSQLM
ncbi:MAG: helix-turn-helix transcriptional regulator, partial [Bdellovibrionota bacterium]